MTRTRTLRRLLLPAAAVTAAALVGAGTAAAGQELPNLTTAISGPSTLTANERGTWTVTVTNTGGIAVMAEDVILDIGDLERRDIAPESLPADGVLDPGEALTYIVSERLHGVICGKPYPISIAAKSRLDGGDESDYDDNRAVAVTQVADCTTDLAIAKSAGAAAHLPGDTVRWTVTVTNAGRSSIALEDVTVSDPMVPGLVLDEAPGDGYLDAGESARYVGTSTVTAANCGVVVNRATVSLASASSLQDLNSANDAAEASTRVTCAPPAAPEAGQQQTPAVKAVRRAAVCPAPKLALAIRSPRSATAGSSFVATLRVRNTSRTGASALKVRYTLPRGTSLVRLPKGASLAGGTLVMNRASLGAGRTATLTLQLRVNRTVAGRVSHSARAGARCTTTKTVVRAQNIRALQIAVVPAVAG